MDSSSTMSYSSYYSNITNPIRSLKNLILRRRPSQSHHIPSSSSIPSRSDTADAHKNRHVITRKSAEPLLAQLFASISAVKAHYAQLQIAQSPYDPDTIQASDRAIVAELKHISYLKHHTVQFSHESSTFAEIQEHRNNVKAFQFTLKNLESVLMTKNLELRSLRKRLLDLEPTAISSLGNLHVSALDPTHLDAALRYAVGSVVFSAHGSIEREAEVCVHMFAGLDRPWFGLPGPSDRRRWWFFEEFRRAMGMGFGEMVEEGLFREFCFVKFGGLEERVMGLLGEVARRVWLVHLLFWSFDEEAGASMFSVGRGCRYSEVYMESSGGEVSSSASAILALGRRKVAFTVVPGFVVRRVVIRSRVVLEGTDGQC